MGGIKGDLIDDSVDPEDQIFRPNRYVKKMMNVTTEGDRTIMTLSGDVYRHASIPEDAAIDYVNQINSAWTKTIIRNDQTIEFRMNLRYAGVASYRRNSSFFIAPCTPNSCTTGYGASLYGRTQFYYSSTQWSGTPAHEMGHLLGYYHNIRAGGCVINCSIMSNAWNRVVTDDDLYGVYKGYK
jgi:hypothetical protein